jgi:hypothetical protein
LDEDLLWSDLLSSLYFKLAAISPKFGMLFLGFDPRLPLLESLWLLPYFLFSLAFNKALYKLSWLTFLWFMSPVVRLGLAPDEYEYPEGINSY